MQRTIVVSFFPLRLRPVVRARWRFIVWVDAFIGGSGGTMPPTRRLKSKPKKQSNPKNGGARALRSSNAPLVAGFGVTSDICQQRSPRRRGQPSPQRSVTAETADDPRRPTSIRGVLQAQRWESILSKSSVDVAKNVSETMPTEVSPPATKAMKAVEGDPADNPSTTDDNPRLGEGGTWTSVVASRMRRCVFAHICIPTTLYFFSQGR